MSIGDTVECKEHGEKQACYVCRHLATSVKEQRKFEFFNAGFSSENPYPDAWCDLCEEKRVELGGDSGNWNAESEKFVGITLVCSDCYDEILYFNTD